MVGFHSYSDNNNKLYIGTKAYDEANKPYTNNLIAVTTSGNVGIGTIYPKQKLHVNNGNIYISSARFRVYYLVIMKIIHLVISVLNI